MTHDILFELAPVFDLLINGGKYKMEASDTDESRNSDSDSNSSGSDIDIDNISNDDFFSDSENEFENSDTQASVSSLETLSSSQRSDFDDPNFWSSELHDIDISPFEEPYGPSHDLDPLDHILRYFYLMFPEDLFDKIAEETNRYAEQAAERAGAPDPSWTPTDPREMKAFIGLWMLMGINQLPAVHMYWSDNKYIG